MEKLLYHGSEKIIAHPVFGGGKPYNDYGFGFYCTESVDMAREWSVGENRDGYANSYKIDCEGLYILDLNAPDFCILHWLSILLKNRWFDTSSSLANESKAYLEKNFSVAYESADVMIGYRADDSYFSFAQDFINGTISYRQLGNAMRLGKLGQQFVLKSKASFHRLIFLGAEPVLASEWYAKKKQRDRAARRDYFNLERNRRQRGDLYITRILDEEMTADDPRLQ